MSYEKNVVCDVCGKKEKANIKDRGFYCKDIAGFLPNAAVFYGGKRFEIETSLVFPGDVEHICQECLEHVREGCKNAD